MLVPTHPPCRPCRCGRCRCHWQPLRCLPYFYLRRNRPAPAGLEAGSSAPSPGDLSSRSPTRSHRAPHSWPLSPPAGWSEAFPCARPAAARPNPLLSLAWSTLAEAQRQCAHRWHRLAGACSAPRPWETTVAAPRRPFPLPLPLLPHRSRRHRSRRPLLSPPASRRLARTPPPLPPDPSLSSLTASRGCSAPPPSSPPLQPRPPSQRPPPRRRRRLRGAMRAWRSARAGGLWGSLAYLPPCPRRAG